MKPYTKPILTVELLDGPDIICGPWDGEGSTEIVDWYEPELEDM